MRRRLVAMMGAVGAALLVASSPAAGTARAQASPQHRAAVIIDTGSTVKHVCILFSGDSVSGKDALDLASQADPSIQPVYRDYGSLGAAVCSLCGTGNPQSDCLGQQSGKYWAYDRAPGGTSTFSQSSEGISNTQVHDGDVEGWHWGTGGAPPYASVEQVCGTVTTDGTFTPTSVATYGGPTQGPGRAAAPAGAAPARPRPSALPATSTVPESTTTSTTSGTGAPPQASSPSGTALARLPSRTGGSGGGGSLAGLVGFGAVAAGLGGWFWWLRHARIARGV